MYKCRHFVTNQDTKKLPRQIYRKLPKVSFKHFSSKKNAIEFYTRPFKDLRPILITASITKVVQQYYTDCVNKKDQRFKKCRSLKVIILETILLATRCRLVKPLISPISLGLLKSGKKDVFLKSLHNLKMCKSQCFSQRLLCKSWFKSFC